MKILRSILLLLIGIFTICAGVDISHETLGELASYKEYGGDAFTGIQNAEVQTGGLVRLQSQLIRESVSTFFYIIGAIIIVCAIPTNLKRKEE